MKPKQQLQRVWTERTPWGWTVFGVGVVKEGTSLREEGRQEIAGPFTSQEAAQAWVEGWWDAHEA